MASPVPQQRAGHDMPPAGKRGGLGVFADNRKRPIHRWYPFIEGYSSELVERAITSGLSGNQIFDPFGGSGTTALTAATLGHSSCFTEVNPYLSWVADVKINQSREGAADAAGLEQILKFVDAQVNWPLPQRTELDHPLVAADSKRAFFPPGVASDVVALVAAIDGRFSGWARQICRLAVGTSLTPASNMIRRTDLRRRRVGDPRPSGLRALFATNLRVIVEDIKDHAPQLLAGAEQLGSDARGPYSQHEPFDLIVTSPPYLNGTNYCRNSKLELLALGFLDSEAHLEHLRAKSVTAGINNVSRRMHVSASVPEVSEVVSQVEQRAYDPRIPKMILGYFSDMTQVFKQLRRESRQGAQLWLDIGDSRYCGVHVPTHQLLAAIASRTGWALMTAEVLRRRRSYDGGELTQQLLTFVAH